MDRVIIHTAGLTLQADLYPNETARRVLTILPVEGIAARWGDEIYFTVPLEMGASPQARTEMQVGELAYWPPGRAICIFWGPTPASRADEPRAASEVNPFGLVQSGAELLDAVADGEPVRLKRNE